MNKPIQLVMPQGSRVFLVAGDPSAISTTAAALAQILKRFDELIDAGEWDTLQDLAACVVFDQAFLYRSLRVRAVSPNESSQFSAKRSDALERLEELAGRLRALGLNEDDLNPLEVLAARVMWQRGPILDADDPLLVKRRRTDPELRGFVIAMASTHRFIFGHPLYRTTATLANVALDRRDVTASRVRQMVRDMPPLDEWWRLGAPVAASNARFRSS